MQPEIFFQVSSKVAVKNHSFTRALQFKDLQTDLLERFKGICWSFPVVQLGIDSKSIFGSGGRCLAAVVCQLNDTDGREPVARL